MQRYSALTNLNEPYIVSRLRVTNENAKQLDT